MDTPHQALIKEKEFKRTVTEMATAFRWRGYHPWISIFSASGFPDLVLVRGSRLIFAELKTEKGIVTAAQHQWLADLKLVYNVEVYLWRPSMMDEIERLLK